MSLQEEVQFVEKAVSSLVGVEAEVRRFQTILLTILAREDTTEGIKEYISDMLSGKWREKLN